jgi:hypothetical protein
MMLALFRSCHLPRMQFAAYSQGSAPSFGRDMTEEKLNRLPRPDRGERVLDAGRAAPTAAIAMSRSGNRRFVLAWVRFTLRWDFAFMTEASNATAHTIRGLASADIASNSGSRHRSTHWTKNRVYSVLPQRLASQPEVGVPLRRA